MTKKNRNDNSEIFRKALLDGASDAIDNQDEKTKEINIEKKSDDNDPTAVISVDLPNPQVKSIEDKTALVHWKALSQAIGGNSSRRKKGDTFPFPRYEYEKTNTVAKQAVVPELKDEVILKTKDEDVSNANNQGVSDNKDEVVQSSKNESVFNVKDEKQNPFAQREAVQRSEINHSPTSSHAFSGLNAEIPPFPKDSVFAASEKLISNKSSNSESVAKLNEGLDKSGEKSSEGSDKPSVNQTASTDSEKTIAVGNNYARKIVDEDSKGSKSTPHLKRIQHLAEKTKTDFRPRIPLSVSVNSTEASLLVEENHRIAQERILQLEKELEKVRGENIELAGHSEVLNIRIEELRKQISESEKKYIEMQESHESEMSVLRSNVEHKNKELDRHKERNKELEWRLASDLRKVRVRERELENRLEIAKAERNALMKAKDDIILELKYQIETLQLEMENYKLRSTEQHKVIESNQEQFKRVVRALRLALSNLENSDELAKPLKKAE